MRQKTFVKCSYVAGCLSKLLQERIKVNTQFWDFICIQEGSSVLVLHGESKCYWSLS